MGKYDKKRTGKNRKGLIIVFLLLAALVFAISMISKFQESERRVNQTNPPVTETKITLIAPSTEIQDFIDTIPSVETVASEETQTPALVETVAPVVDSENMVIFPLLAVDGKLEIESLFQFEGINPDCDNLEGEKIAAIIVRNVSDVYMKEAKISMVLGDGTGIFFVISDLPAGKSTVAFSTDNTELSDDFCCVSVSTDAVFENVDSVDGISVTVDGMMVTVTNNSANELYGIDVYCRGVFGEWYFGGVTYVYTIEKLAVGESTTITAVDCILGVVDVVRVAVNEKN